MNIINLAINLPSEEASVSYPESIRKLLCVLLATLFSVYCALIVCPGMLQLAKHQWEMPSPVLSPIPILLLNGMRLRTFSLLCLLRGGLFLTENF